MLVLGGDLLDAAPLKGHRLEASDAEVVVILRMLAAGEFSEDQPAE